jgi:hypothetical protein
VKLREVMGISIACKTRPPACENSTGEVGAKRAFDKLKKIREMILVGASGFEPEASCAQGRRATRLRYAPTSDTYMILLYFPAWFLVTINADHALTMLNSCQ